MDQAFVILLHGAINMFGGGRSVARIFLFAGIFLAAFLLSRRRPTKNPQKFNLKPLVFFLITLILGASMQVWFSHRLGISPFDYALVIEGPEVTSTSLLHNHFGKAAFGDLAKTLGPKGFERVDPGSAIASITPFSFKIPFIAALIAFVISAFVSYTGSLPNRRRLSCALGFSALLLVTAKSAVDGGVLAEHGILGAGLLAALSTRDSKAFWRISTTGLFAQFLWYGFAQLLGLYSSSDETWLVYALASLGTWCFVSYFMARSLYPDAERGLLKICSFGWISIMTVCALSQLQLVSYRMLPADGARVATYVEQTDLSYTLVSKTGELFIYEYTGPKTAGDIIDENGALDNTYPVAVPWKTCLPTEPPEEISFIERNFETGSYASRSVPLEACQPRPVSFLQESVKGDGKIVILTDIEGL